MSRVVSVRYEDMSWELLPLKNLPLGVGSNGNYKILLEYTLELACQDLQQYKSDFP